MSYSYRFHKDAGCYTVHDAGGEPESDHRTANEAAARVAYLNGGGTPPPDVATVDADRRQRVEETARLFAAALIGSDHRIGFASDAFDFAEMFEAERSQRASGK